MSNRIVVQSGYTLPSFDGLRKKRKSSSKKGASQRTKFTKAAKACSNGKFKSKGHRSYQSCMKSMLKK